METYTEQDLDDMEELMKLGFDKSTYIEAYVIRKNPQRDPELNPPLFYKKGGKMRIYKDFLNYYCSCCSLEELKRINIDDESQMSDVQTYIDNYEEKEGVKELQKQLDIEREINMDLQNDRDYYFKLCKEMYRIMNDSMIFKEGLNLEDDDVLIIKEVNEA
jgi:hypothetical protein